MSTQPDGKSEQVMTTTPPKPALQIQRLVTSSECHPMVQLHGSEATTRTQENEQKIAQTNGHCVPGSETFDPLDRDLWAAAQTIRLCRQDRIAASQNYNNLQGIMQNLRNNHAKLTADYNELYDNYEIIRGRYGNLREKYNAVLADSAKNTKEWKQLEGVQLELGKQRELRRVTEAKLEQMKDQMEKKDDQLAQLESKLADCWRQTTDGQGNEIETLRAMIATHDQTMESYKEEKSAYAAESLASQTLIQHMEQWQNELEQELAKVNEEMLQQKQHVDSLEMDKRMLQQKCQLQNQQLAQIKEALTSRFPDLDDNMDNINTVLGQLEKQTRKRRKQIR